MNDTTEFINKIEQLKRLNDVIIQEAEARGAIQAYAKAAARLRLLAEEFEGGSAAAVNNQSPRRTKTAKNHHAAAGNGAAPAKSTGTGKSPLVTAEQVEQVAELLTAFCAKDPKGARPSQIKLTMDGKTFGPKTSGACFRVLAINKRAVIDSQGRCRIPAA